MYFISNPQIPLFHFQISKLTNFQIRNCFAFVYDLSLILIRMFRVNRMINTPDCNLTYLSVVLTHVILYEI